MIWFVWMITLFLIFPRPFFSDCFTHAGNSFVIILLTHWASLAGLSPENKVIKIDCLICCWTKKPSSSLLQTHPRSAPRPDQCQVGWTPSLHFSPQCPEMSKISRYWLRLTCHVRDYLWDSLHLVQIADNFNHLIHIHRSWELYFDLVCLIFSRNLTGTILVIHLESPAEFFFGASRLCHVGCQHELLQQEKMKPTKKLTWLKWGSLHFSLTAVSEWITRGYWSDPSRKAFQDVKL